MEQLLLLVIDNEVKFTSVRENMRENMVLTLKLFHPHGITYVNGWVPVVMWGMFRVDSRQ